ncbi:MAG TPA: hypothetical protein VK465_09235 [Fibrobacteria bacterium]|nr:hypothetical protein [Fibrobacteria bacterium]
MAVDVWIKSHEALEKTIPSDADSMAKGIQIEGQYLVWRRTQAQVGLHSGTITANISGTNITKKFSIEVSKTVPNMVGIHSLLLD